jgi:hypothetical protein
MDLEIVGRHALLFDDDATAEVVNSGGSLVPWAAVGAADHLLDRHDVRHLLDRVPPRPRRAYSRAILSVPSSDGVSEAELDRERYHDLPAAVGGGEDEGSGDAALSGINISSLWAGLYSLLLLYSALVSVTVSFCLAFVVCLPYFALKYVLFYIFKCISACTLKTSAPCRSRRSYVCHLSEMS